MTGRAVFNVILIAVVITVLGYLLVYWRPRPEWEVLIRDGQATVVHGKVNGRFVAECQMICDQWKVSRGRVAGSRNPDGRISLRFSREIPPQHHQRFRNAWGMHA